jgi:hypothetical protein
VQRQRSVHALCVLREPDREFVRHLADHVQLVSLALNESFTHHAQHHRVLGRVAVAGGEVRLAHPAIFLCEVLARVVDQISPRFYEAVVWGVRGNGKQVDEFAVRLVHQRQVQREGVGPKQFGHRCFLWG